MIQPVQLTQHHEHLDLYCIDTDVGKGAPIAFIVSDFGRLGVYKSLACGEDYYGECLFVSTDFEACLTYVTGMAYQHVANLIA